MKDNLKTFKSAQKNKNIILNNKVMMVIVKTTLFTLDDRTDLALPNSVLTCHFHLLLQCHYLFFMLEYYIRRTINFKLQSA